MLLFVNNCYQKSNDYTQFIESLNNTSWNVYFVCDKKDRIKEVSESLLLELGLERKDVLGRKAFDVFDQTIRFTHVNENIITNGSKIAIANPCGVPYKPPKVWPIA